MLLTPVKLSLLVAAGLSAPISVDVHRTDYTEGAQVFQCYLTEAAAYNGTVLVVDCHSDLDGLFHNGFD